MIDFTIETHIDRSPAAVFAHATDPARLATWQTNTVSAVADGPFAVGARIREVHRGPGGRELESVVEVAALEPDRHCALRVVEGPPIHADMDFRPAGAGTAFSFRVHGRLTGGLRLLEPLLRRVLRRQFTQHCANLKRVLETG